MKLKIFTTRYKATFRGTMARGTIALLLSGIASISVSFAQTVATPPPTFPRMVGYQGILHPIVTLDKDHVETNFSDYYVVGFPIGLNLWKTKQV
ncbi:hypothetical protein [Dyadobacter fanqingshengii]|uniref:Uncharacterized protein n=1 Tax=Dyadobacter fanqingshengii TaxID=2906443 RepID=A0A9X1P7P7_9BACT|nr:hypothetical protein [Dyadobacter fanqingshengii]MCF0039911.1 hypothetical protein [Dyadobacter fanqingshengii]USJ38330.1 hypothetical protein NFI81_11220 [Dyadobacter fanqingshengii]